MIISIEPKLNYEREFYVGVTWDTVAKLPVALLSLAGGVDVESSQSDQLTRQPFDPWTGSYLIGQEDWLPQSA